MNEQITVSELNRLEVECQRDGNVSVDARTLRTLLASYLEVGELRNGLEELEEVRGDKEDMIEKLKSIRSDINDLIG